MEKAIRMFRRKDLRCPHVYVMLLTVVAICAILTYIVPAVQYEMMESASGRTVVNPDSFMYIENTPVGLMDFLKSVPDGMVETASIIFFIFMVGGAFSVVEATGAVFGMAEETLPFIPIMVTLAIALGFDSLKELTNSRKLGFNGFAENLLNGFANLAGGALVVGFARAILVVLTNGHILDTILYSSSNVLLQLPSAVSAVGMYVFQCFLNFIVPSGSGQAAVSIPILAPLSDLVGVTRQTAVLAYQFGDGISNIFTPTSGYFMAGPALAKIPWQKWVKWILPLILTQYVVAGILVFIAHSMNYGPF
jgi:uncharacterized ion transporter superfamily protein YfcC